MKKNNEDFLHLLEDCDPRIKMAHRAKEMFEELKAQVSSPFEREIEAEIRGHIKEVQNDMVGLPATDANLYQMKRAINNILEQYELSGEIYSSSYKVDRFGNVSVDICYSPPQQINRIEYTVQLD